MPDFTPDQVAEFFKKSAVHPYKVIDQDDRVSIPFVEHINNLANSGPACNDEKIIGVDNRTATLDGSLYPWSRICRLRVLGPANQYCVATGWLAGPKTVITAGHVVYDVEWPGWDGQTAAWASSVEVWTGFLKGQALGYAIASRLRTTDAWKTFIDDHPEEGARRQQIDVGCIQLDAPLSTENRFFGLDVAPDSALAGELITASGYPDDKDGGEVQYCGSDRIQGLSATSFYHLVDTYGGESGAPVWLGDRNTRQPMVVGIHTGGSDEEKRNWAVRMTDDVAELIQGWVAANP